jgi:T4 RnlA family RNA ligase
MQIENLNQLITEGYINVQKHPTADLYIYNYSPKAQYDRVWNEWTLACRGLIMDGKNEIIARPFQKFFNLGEYENQPIPNESFEVYEKMDGSLGILYWLDNEERRPEPFIATRGSFLSDQAIIATEMLKTKYSESILYLDQSKTYLFEIIYPENRIVLDYGDERKLVLLAIIDTKTGEEFPLEDTFHATLLQSHGPITNKYGFEIVKKYDGLNDLQKLKELEEANKEGFVVKFHGGYRLKIKFEEYVRIHRIVTQVSSYNIWEFLKAGQDLLPILEKVPDEFYDWVKATHSKLLAQYAEIELVAKQDFKILEDRKGTALYFQTCKYPNVLYKMLDKKPYDEVIWKLIKPKYERPFANRDEN